MAESKGSSGARPVRLVGRIVDPSVREDAHGEPRVELQSERLAGARRERGSGPPTGSHPVRDRLLARARSVGAVSTPAVAVGDEAAGERHAAPSASGVDDSDSTYLVRDDDLVEDEWRQDGAEFSSLRDVVDDLDSIAAPKPAAEREQAPLRSASASLTLATLLGVLGLGIAFAIAVEVSPRAALVAGVEKPAVEAAPSSQDSPAPEPIARPERKLIEGPWRVEDGASDPELKLVSGQVGERTFLGAVEASDLALREAYRVLVAFKGLKNLDKCRPGDEFRALVDRASGRLKAFEYVVSVEEVYQARENDEGLLEGRQLDLHVEKQRVTGVVQIADSFDDSAYRAGFEQGLSSAVDKALSGFLTTSDMQRGDVLGIVAQEVTVLGAFSRYAGVEALEYRSGRAEPIRVYYHSAGKMRGYVDEKGRMFGRTRWAKPVHGAPITSRFNPKRMHPILKVIKPHNGTDFGALSGTPVLAAALGTVSFVGKAGPNGNLVTIQHSGGYQTGYSHLSRFAKGLRAGDRVSQKQVIGYVGSTGRSTGPHLHFSVKKNDRFIDPESLGLGAFARLPVSDRQLLARLRRRYDDLLDALQIPEPAAPPLQTEVAALSAGEAPSEAGEAPPEAGEAPPVAPTPSARPTASASEARGTSKPLSIYVTDLELMRRQPRAHSGEVAR